VLKDRRQSPRRSINRVAKFHSGLGALPRDCTVTDISDCGARLFSELDMPEQFTLSLSGDGIDIRQECRVVWRLGGEFGVEFTGRRSR
jgi:PilZ domain